MGPSGGPGAGEAAALEPRGDQLAAEAERWYAEASRVWLGLQIAARRRSDAVLERRAREARVSLAATRLDVGLVESLARGAGAAPSGGSAAAPPVRPWPVLAAVGVEPDPAALERLASFLEAVGRDGESRSGVDPRDASLLREGQALVLRCRADIDQLAADRAYLAALRLVEAELAGRPDHLAASARLRFKLRDFDGAWEMARRLDDGSGLEADERGKHWRLLADLSRLRGRSDLALAYRHKADAASGRAAEPTLGQGRLPSIVAGSRANLVRVVSGFVGLVSSFRLPPRQGAIAAWLGGSAAIDLGEDALAEELLRGRADGAGGDSWLQAALLARLAWVRDGIGDYEGGLDALRRASRIWESLEGTESLSREARLERSRLLTRLGKHESALAVAREVLVDPESGPAERTNARLLIGSALYQEAGEKPARLRDALGAFRAARRDVGPLAGLDEGIELGVKIDIAEANGLRLEAMRQKGELARATRQRAMALQESAMRLAHEKGWHDLAAIAAGNLGELELESGDLDQARRFVEWALARARELDRFETRWRCHWYLGRIAEARGDEAGADREFASALELVESYRERIIGAETKSGFLSDKLDLYRHLVAREVHRARPERALEIAERGKARALVEGLGWRFVALASARETDLYRQYLRLVARASRPWERRPSASLAGGALDVALEDESRESSLDSVRRRLRELRERIVSSSESSPALRALVDGAPASAAEIRRSLPEGVALLEYVDLGDRLAAIAFGPRRSEVIPLSLDRAGAADRVDRFLRSGASDEGLARELHAALLAPVEGRIGTDRVIIVPQGSLYRLPFEALRSPAGYQVQRWEISYLPSASLLRFLGAEGRRPSKGSGAGASLLAFADPLTDYDGDGRRDKMALPGAREEVKGFSGRFASKWILSGRSAAEAVLRRLATRADVLHIACHGEFYPARPWDSTLFLAPAGDRPSEDGRLRASEVYGLDLRGRRLIALSGCQTGLGRTRGGDDRDGMATAFLHAGASSLLVSLWKVEDRATAELMKRFYESWITGGRSRVAALRQAKRELLAGAFAEPRQWASFILLGNR